MTPMAERIGQALKSLGVSVVHDTLIDTIMEQCDVRRFLASLDIISAYIRDNPQIDASLIGKGLDKSLYRCSYDGSWDIIIDTPSFPYEEIVRDITIYRDYDNFPNFSGMNTDQMRLMVAVVMHFYDDFDCSYYERSRAYFFIASLLTKLERYGYHEHDDLIINHIEPLIRCFSLAQNDQENYNDIIDNLKALAYDDFHEYNMDIWSTTVLFNDILQVLLMMRRRGERTSHITGSSYGIINQYIDRGLTRKETLKDIISAYLHHGKAQYVNDTITSSTVFMAIRWAETDILLHFRRWHQEVETTHALVLSQKPSVSGALLRSHPLNRYDKDIIMHACTMPTEFTMEEIMLTGKAYRYE